jgi:hypothetical protein
MARGSVAGRRGVLDEAGSLSRRKVHQHDVESALPPRGEERLVAGERLRPPMAPLLVLELGQRRRGPSRCRNPREAARLRRREEDEIRVGPGAPSRRVRLGEGNRAIAAEGEHRELRESSGSEEAEPFARRREKRRLRPFGSGNQSGFELAERPHVDRSPIAGPRRVGEAPAVGRNGERASVLQREGRGRGEVDDESSDERLRPCGG